jgi:NADPH:quinone reductase-like Zn-dependent oxidoreductase
MLAAAAVRFSPDDPLSALEVGPRREPIVPDGWTTVELRSAAVNHHDLWSLRGVGLREQQLPMVLGCDGAGVSAAGDDVVVHALVADPAAGNGDETIDPGRTLLSEKHDGTLAEVVAVPRRNLVPKPASIGWEEAACLPSAWLTAYRMIFKRSGLPASGGTMLIQGAGGGVATAALLLGKAAGHMVIVTSRDEARRKQALTLGADVTLPTGILLPGKVDAVIETVGEATWQHSLRSLRPGGTLVLSGATSGHNPPADLRRIFFLQLAVVGSTMGTRDELQELLEFLDRTGVRPVIDEVRPLSQTRQALSRMHQGRQFGKLVLTV